jgi:O-antigen/teichoic acid export membrane protein
VLRILAAGIFFSCLAYAPNALLEAIGRPDVTAKFIMLQAVVFLPLSALMLWAFGIEGAAIAWALRALADGAGKLFLAVRTYPAAAAPARTLIVPLIASAVALAATVLAPEGWWSAGVASAGLLLVAGVTLGALSASERQKLRPLLTRPWRIKGMLKG